MAQIVQPQPTWQEALGSGLGQGVQAGVTSLLEQKLQNMAQEQQANQRFKALEGLQKSGVLGEGFTPEALSALKYAPESLLNTLLKERMKGPANQAYAQAAADVAGGIPVTEVLKKYPGLQGPQINALTTAASEQAKTLQKQKEFGISQTKDWRNQLQSDIESNAIQRSELGRLKTLIMDPNTATGFAAQLPKELQTSTTQEANKILKRIASQAVKGTTTDYKLQTLLESMAELATTKEAAMNAIHTAEEALKIPEIVDKYADKIEMEHAGIPPHNLRTLAWKRAEPEINKILDSIEKGRDAAQGWVTNEQMPASKYKGRKRIAEDGTEEISNGREWLKVSKARG